MSSANTRAFERISLHEGSVSVPQEFEDRTTNLFVPSDPLNQPNLSIARDWLTDGENLPAYVDRQLALLKRRLPGHKAVSRRPEQLGRGEATLAGERIDSLYRNGALTVHQRQAAFLVAQKRALIFTATSPRSFDGAFEALWRAWLDSFTHASAATQPVHLPSPGNTR